MSTAFQSRCITLTADSIEAAGVTRGSSRCHQVVAGAGHPLSTAARAAQLHASASQRGLGRRMLPDFQLTSRNVQRAVRVLEQVARVQDGARLVYPHVANKPRVVMPADEAMLAALLPPPAVFFTPAARQALDLLAAEGASPVPRDVVELLTSCQASSLLASLLPALPHDPTERIVMVVSTGITHIIVERKFFPTAAVVLGSAFDVALTSISVPTPEHPDATEVHGVLRHDQLSADDTGVTFHVTCGADGTWRASVDLSAAITRQHWTLEGILARVPSMASPESPWRWPLFKQLLGQAFATTMCELEGTASAQVPVTCRVRVSADPDMEWHIVPGPLAVSATNVDVSIASDGLGAWRWDVGADFRLFGGILPLMRGELTSGALAGVGEKLGTATASSRLPPSPGEVWQSASASSGPLAKLLCLDARALPEGMLQAALGSVFQGQRGWGTAVARFLQLPTAHSAKVHLSVNPQDEFATHIMIELDTEGDLGGDQRLRLNPFRLTACSNDVSTVSVLAALEVTEHTSTAQTAKAVVSLDWDTTRGCFRVQWREGDGMTSEPAPGDVPLSQRLLARWFPNCRCELDLVQVHLSTPPALLIRSTSAEVPLVSGKLELVGTRDVPVAFSVVPPNLDAQCSVRLFDTWELPIYVHVDSTRVGVSSVAENSGDVVECADAGRLTGAESVLPAVPDAPHLSDDNVSLAALSTTAIGARLPSSLAAAFGHLRFTHASLRYDRDSSAATVWANVGATLRLSQVGSWAPHPLVRVWGASVGFAKRPGDNGAVRVGCHVGIGHGDIINAVGCLQYDLATTVFDMAVSAELSSLTLADLTRAFGHGSGDAYTDVGTSPGTSLACSGCLKMQAGGGTFAASVKLGSWQPFGDCEALVLEQLKLAVTCEFGGREPVAAVEHGGEESKGNVADDEATLQLSLTAKLLLFGHHIVVTSQRMDASGVVLTATIHNLDLGAVATAFATWLGLPPVVRDAELFMISFDAVELVVQWTSDMHALKLSFSGGTAEPPHWFPFMKLENIGGEVEYARETSPHWSGHVRGALGAGSLMLPTFRLDFPPVGDEWCLHVPCAPDQLGLPLGRPASLTSVFKELLGVDLPGGVFDIEFAVLGLDWRWNAEQTTRCTVALGTAAGDQFPLLSLGPVALSVCDITLHVKYDSELASAGDTLAALAGSYLSVVIVLTNGGSSLRLPPADLVLKRGGAWGLTMDDSGPACGIKCREVINLFGFDGDAAHRLLGCGDVSIKPYLNLQWGRGGAVELCDAVFVVDCNVELGHGAAAALTSVGVAASYSRDPGEPGRTQRAARLLAHFRLGSVSLPVELHLEKGEVRFGQDMFASEAASLRLAVRQGLGIDNMKLRWRVDAVLNAISRRLCDGKVTLGHLSLELRHVVVHVGPHPLVNIQARLKLRSGREVELAVDARCVPELEDAWQMMAAIDLGTAAFQCSDLWARLAVLDGFLPAMSEVVGMVGAVSGDNDGLHQESLARVLRSEFLPAATREKLLTYHAQLRAASPAPVAVVACKFTFNDGMLYKCLGLSGESIRAGLVVDGNCHPLVVCPLDSVLATVKEKLNLRLESLDLLLLPDSISAAAETIIDLRGAGEGDDTEIKSRPMRLAGAFTANSEGVTAELVLGGTTKWIHPFGLRSLTVNLLQAGVIVPKAPQAAVVVTAGVDGVLCGTRVSAAVKLQCTPASIAPSALYLRVENLNLGRFIGCLAKDLLAISIPDVSAVFPDVHLLEVRACGFVCAPDMRVTLSQSLTHTRTHTYTHNTHTHTAAAPSPLLSSALTRTCNTSSVSLTSGGSRQAPAHVRSSAVC